MIALMRVFLLQG